MSVTDFDRTPGELAAQANGVEIDEVEFIDYFGVAESTRWYLPGQEDIREDRKQWIEFGVLLEGDIAALQSASNNEVVVQRASGDAKMKVDQAKDRHALIHKAVTNWMLFQRSQSGEPEAIAFPRQKQHFEDIIKTFNPKLVADLEKAIRKANPSLSGDVSSDDIKDQIEQLNKDLESALKREQGKEGS